MSAGVSDGAAVAAAAAAATLTSVGAVGALGAGGGTAAAAAVATAKWDEEEEMTGYHPNDLSDGWEFKILRSSTAAFKSPQRMRAILEEEKKAGWILVEKFDDCRIRLKRSAGVAAHDAKLDIDPYRTNVGISQGWLALVILSLFCGVIVALFGLIMVTLAR